MKKLLFLSASVFLFSCEKTEVPCSGCGTVIEIVAVHRMSDGSKQVTYTLENECGTFDIVSSDLIVTDADGYIAIGDNLCE